jgi:hypothetical protein
MEMEFLVDLLLRLTLHKIAHLTNWEELVKGMIQTLSPEEMRVLRHLCISRREEQNLNSIRQISYLVFLIDNRQYRESMESSRVQRRQD